jgi:hypothetical protein
MVPHNGTGDMDKDGGPPKPPDLQKLVAQYGGYNLPPEAWQAWDQANAEYVGVLPQPRGTEIIELGGSPSLGKMHVRRSIKGGEAGVHALRITV